MRQMFDASQIMKVKDCSNLLTGISTSKPRSITIEDMSAIINSDAIYFNTIYYFNKFPKYKLSTFIEDEYEFYFYAMPTITKTGASQQAVAFTYNPTTKLVDVTVERNSFSKA